MYEEKRNDKFFCNLIFNSTIFQYVLIFFPIIPYEIEIELLFLILH